ncbi:hypothetical protein LWI29_003474 [Acer saccharum]|uniref:RNase H type-1 domain-containing protein n=1 Tax=Acer saccharum TaxID=4024 RepID=A0AA39S2I5_ACESA|nr:hypothetical protein LWI29_003474 [Acer saccharum]
MKWDEESERAFRELQSYLSNPPLLVKPLPGDVLQLYLAVSDMATSATLVKECEGGIQRPIYYVSRSLNKTEKNYNQLEKLAFALVVVARKLHPYFQAHSIAVLTNLPLWQFMQRPNVSGKLVSWALELTQYDITFKPRVAIKRHALADFVAEFNGNPDFNLEGEPAAQTNNSVLIPGEEWPSQSSVWILFVDGAFNQHGCRAGIVLIDPEGIESSHCLRFEFRTTNNEAKYEALLAGLNATRELGAQFLAIKSDS